MQLGKSKLITAYDSYLLFIFEREKVLARCQIHRIVPLCMMKEYGNECK